MPLTNHNWSHHNADVKSTGYSRLIGILIKHEISLEINIIYEILCKADIRTEIDICWATNGNTMIFFYLVIISKHKIYTHLFMRNVDCIGGIIENCQKRA